MDRGGLRKVELYYRKARPGRLAVPGTGDLTNASNRCFGTENYYPILVLEEEEVEVNYYSFEARNFYIVCSII